MDMDHYTYISDFCYQAVDRVIVKEGLSLSDWGYEFDGCMAQNGIKEGTMDLSRELSIRDVNGDD